MDVSSSGAAGTMNMLASHAEGDVAKAAFLMKKVMKQEKMMIDKLLPLPQPQTGLDIQA